jgi:hypothetical protein
MSIALTSAWIQSRRPDLDPYETVTVAESLHKLAKTVSAGKKWSPIDLERYGLACYECDNGDGPRLALAALDGAEPVAWARDLPGVWLV